MMSDNSAKCLVCERDSNQIPLMAFQYRLATVWICPEHLPILIHQPGRLADRLGEQSLEKITILKIFIQ